MVHSFIFALFTSRPDKEWSLTDCTSFAVMHERGLTDALAADHHASKPDSLPSSNDPLPPRTETEYNRSRADSSAATANRSITSRASTEPQARRAPNWKDVPDGVAALFQARSIAVAFEVLNPADPLVIRPITAYDVPEPME